MLQNEIKRFRVTRQCKKAFEIVQDIVKDKEYKVIETQDMLLAVALTNDTGAGYALGRHSLTRTKLRDEIITSDRVKKRDIYTSLKSEFDDGVSEIRLKKARNEYIKNHPVEFIQEPSSDRLIYYMTDYPVSKELLKILQFADEMREQIKPNGGIDTYWILIGMIEEEESNAYQIIEKLMLKFSNMYNGGKLTDNLNYGIGRIRHYYDGKTEEEEAEKKARNSRLTYKLNNPDYSILYDIATDITEKARNNEFVHVINREDTIKHMEIALTRRDKNNVALIGKGGVGKSAIVEGLAMKIVNDEIPSLKGKKILQFNLNDLITTIAGDPARAIQRFISEMKKEKDVLLFIDEMHMFGKVKSLTDTLKPAMARGDFRIIGATTPNEWLAYMANDTALVRRFEKVIVEEPSIDDAINILKEAIVPYERFHKVHYDIEAIEFAVRRGKDYFPKEQLPDLAFTILDNAGAICRIKSGEEIEMNVQYSEKLKSLKESLEAARQIEFNEEEIEKIRTQIDALQREYNQQRASTKKDKYRKSVTIDTVRTAIEQKLGEELNEEDLLDDKSQKERLRNLTARMKDNIIGQDEAIETVANSVLRTKLGFKKPNRPIGVYMFLGTTGVGKTETVKVLSEALYNDKKHIIRFDMSEYQQEHEVSKLIGAPPGYVGFQQAGLLTNAVKENPKSIILFDEIEKANVKIFDTLLQVFDEGRLTDAMGMTVDFSDTIIILTSNIGASDIRSRNIIGFEDNVNSELDFDNIEKTVKNALVNHFRPEFLNRIDEMITFRPLEQPQTLQITQLVVDKEIKIIEEAGYHLKVTPDTVKYISNVYYDEKNGARPIKRGTAKLIEDLLVDKILSKELKKGDHVTIDTDKNNDLIVSIKNQ
ncbi:TPA: AAA family ATPase [Staphylococcus aureus]